MSKRNFATCRLTTTELKSTAGCSDKKSDLRAPRQKHHLSWRRTFPLQECSSSQFHWHSSQWNPRHFFPEQHKVLREHPQGIVRQYRVVRWHDHVPRDWCMTKELTPLAPPTMKIKLVAPPEKSTRYRLEDLSCSSQHIPADVDLEGEFSELARPPFVGSASALTILTLHFGATVLYGD